MEAQNRDIDRLFKIIACQRLQEAIVKAGICQSEDSHDLLNAKEVIPLEEGRRERNGTVIVYFFLGFI